MINNRYADMLLNKLKEKGIFSEYLPESFKIDLNKWDLYVAGAATGDRIEPYSYYMSRFGKNGHRRLISIPEISAYVLLINYLNDNKSILLDLIMASKDDINSFSRFVNSDVQLLDENNIYGESVPRNIIDESSENYESEKDYSLFLLNMAQKINLTKGAKGILHVDISEFYKNIYTHIVGCISLGIDGIKKAYDENKQTLVYKRYCGLDEKIRRMNGLRTNGFLVGPYISRVLSEGILSVVDNELRQLGIKFTRYADDYEIALYDNDDWQCILNSVINIFDKFYLKINEEKTYYEEYPFYLFNNYEKVLKSFKAENTNLRFVDVIEIFNKFLQMEKAGDKGAVAYLLKAYSKNYTVYNKKLYTNYLLNIICNDERNMSYACKIIVDEYKNSRLYLDSDFYKKIISQISVNIKKNNDLAIVWLTYLLVYTNYKFKVEDIITLVEGKSELGMIIIMEELPHLITLEIKEKCWNELNSWLFLYQFSLRYPEYREQFFEKVRINKNKNFYNKLFLHNFSFYKKEEKTEPDKLIDNFIDLSKLELD